MGRFLAVCLLALLACGAASAANVRAATDPLEPQEWWLAKIGADPALAPPPGVPLTIVDSGVDPTHPEFAGRPNTTFMNTQTVLGSVEFHGTFVASVAAAPENGVGMIGVYPTAALQVFDASPFPGNISDLEAIAGIDQAAQHCPGVISLSFGGSHADELLFDEILTAVHNGCLVVAAAGNDGQIGSPPTYPASFPHVFTVAATDQNDAVAPFSTVSPANDVAAPGVDITGAVPLSHDASGYEMADGTSFAAPMVSAAAAWVWTLRPTLSASQLAALLREGRGHRAARVRQRERLGHREHSGLARRSRAPAGSRRAERRHSRGEARPAVPLRRVAADDDREAEHPHLRDAQRVGRSPRRLPRLGARREDSARDGLVRRPRRRAHLGTPDELDERGARCAAARPEGPSIKAGKKGTTAYVEVLLTGRSVDASYVLSVTASKH